MTANDEARAAALQRVAEATANLQRVQELAHSAMNQAGRLRAQAVKAALQHYKARELAEELGVSVQRVYELAREAEKP